MLSIAKCRRLVGKSALPDEEIRELRDELYLLGNVVLDVLIETGRVQESDEEGEP